MSETKTVTVELSVAEWQAILEALPTGAQHAALSRAYEAVEKAVKAA